MIVDLFNTVRLRGHIEFQGGCRNCMLFSKRLSVFLLLNLRIKEQKLIKW